MGLCHTDAAQQELTRLYDCETGCEGAIFSEFEQLMKVQNSEHDYPPPTSDDKQHNRRPVLFWKGSFLYLHPPLPAAQDDVFESAEPMEVVAAGEGGRRIRRVEPVNGELLEKTVDQCKQASRSIVQCVLNSFKARFPSNEWMDALSIIDVRYWSGPEVDFLQLSKHVEFLCKQYGVDKGAAKALINSRLLKKELSYFVDYMQKHANLAVDTSSLWLSVARSETLSSLLSQWLIIARITLVLPIGSVANEREFSLVNFVKNERRNRLNMAPLNACLSVGMCPGTLEECPFEKAFTHWNDAKETRGRYHKGEVKKA